jgi:diketogulonate reductase-like aldo/keto reductase
MNYTHLGRTGLKVSRLCLGTMNFGDVTDEKTSARILDEALEAGINFIDTADVYGTEQSPDIQQGSGLSEEISDRRRRSGFGRNHPWQERRRDGETGWSGHAERPFGCCSRPEGNLNHA